jgi:transposase
MKNSILINAMHYNPIEKSWAHMKRALIDIIPTCEDVPAAVYQYFGVDIS